MSGAKSSTTSWVPLPEVKDSASIKEVGKHSTPSLGEWKPSPIPNSSSKQSGGIDSRTQSGNQAYGQYRKRTGWVQPLKGSTQIQRRGEYEQTKLNNNNAKLHRIPQVNSSSSQKECERNVGRFTLFFRKGSPLSNFYPCRFTDDQGREYCCTEQYYQYHKALVFGDHTMASQIIKSRDQAFIKRCGANVKGYKTKKEMWRKIHAEKVMRPALYFKFSQNPNLRRHLLNTNDVIAEANPTDDFFGIGMSLDNPNITCKESCWWNSKKNSSWSKD